jgi:hypothetical protein
VNTLKGITWVLNAAQRAVKPPSEVADGDLGQITLTAAAVLPRCVAFLDASIRTICQSDSSRTSIGTDSIPTARAASIR